MTIEDVTTLPFIATGAEALFQVAPVTGDANHGRAVILSLIHI